MWNLCSCDHYTLQENLGCCLIKANLKQVYPQYNYLFKQSVGSATHCMHTTTHALCFHLVSQIRIKMHIQYLTCSIWFEFLVYLYTCIPDLSLFDITAAGRLNAVQKCVRWVFIKGNIMLQWLYHTEAFVSSVLITVLWRTEGLK
jgi:hypothetical protein